MSTYISIDVEADGPIPGKYSMVSFGAVVVDEKLDKTFYGQVRPVTSLWIPEALAVSGHTRKEHNTFPPAALTMRLFAEWLRENSNGSPIFISDNPAFDWQWINYYFHSYTDKGNPFGFSARRIGDLYCGLVKHVGKNRDWKRKFRKTKHTHHPVDDAKGNAEALLAFEKELGLNIKF